MKNTNNIVRFKTFFCIVIATFFVSLFSVTTAGAAFVFSTERPSGLDVQLYGSVRFETFRIHHSAETKNLPYSIFNTYEGTATGGNDYDTTCWQFEKYVSNIGALFTSKEGKFSGNIELRPGYSSDMIRLFYGTYDFGFVKVLIGKSWDPVFLQGVGGGTYFHGGLSPAIGELTSPIRQEQISLWFPVRGVGMFALGVLKPSGSNTVSGLTVSKTSYDLPHVVATYSSKYFGPFAINVWGGYNKTQLQASNAKEYDVTGWTVGIGPRLKIGPLEVSASLWTGENINNYTNGPIYFEQTPLYNSATDSIIDAKMNYAGILKVAYQFTPNVRAEIHAGQYESERDATGTAGYTHECKGITMTLPVTVAKGISISPEVGYIDWGSMEYKDNKTTTDLGKSWIAGIYWRMDF